MNLIDFYTKNNLLKVDYKSMKILIVGIGSKLHLEIAWARAFKTLGYDTEIFAFNDHLNFYNRYLIQRTLFFSEGINQKLVDFADNYKPGFSFSI